MNALLPPPAILPFDLAHRWLSLALVGPIPALSFLLQVVAVGSAIGAAVALRASRRSRHVDISAITTAWATLALIVGVLIELLSSWA
jgi:hypothetical protein